MTEKWSEDKGKKILRKYRYTLTFRIIAVGLMLLTFYIIYVSALSITYDKTSKGEKLTTYAQLYIDWLYPDVSSSYTPASAHISPKLTQSTSIPVQRQVGKERIVVGELEVEKPVITSLLKKRLNFHNPQEQSDFRFYVPQHPESGEPLSAGDSTASWETLDKIHEGTVAEMAFSTEEYFSPEELFELLEGYDIMVNWMPLYMGEMTNFDPHSVSGFGYGSGSAESLAFEPWGLTHGREIDEDYWIGSTYYMSAGSVEDAQVLMLENMKRIYQDDSKLTEAMFSSGNIEERIEFLEDEGFIVYGAVVTGPTKELLLLQEIEEIRGVQVGEITLWNWVD